MGILCGYQRFFEFEGHRLTGCCTYVPQPKGLHGCSPEVLPCPSPEGHFHMRRPAVRLRVGMKTGKFGSLRDPGLPQVFNLQQPLIEGLEIEQPKAIKPGKKGSIY